MWLSCDFVYSRSRKAGGGGMQLGKKKKNIDNFVGQIEAEGGSKALFYDYSFDYLYRMHTV